MKRCLLYIGLLLMTLACVRELPEWEQGSVSPNEEGKVTITFSIPAVGGGPTTKVLGEGGTVGPDQELETLHLAVYGSSGFLKEYVKAKYLGISGTTSYPTDDVRDGDVPKIVFSATLTLSEKQRTIHFIGNGPTTLPFSHQTQLFSLLSEEDKPAYWQTITVPKISAETGAGGQLVPDSQTLGYFTDIALIRNWSKISIVLDTENGNDPNFELEKFALVHFPIRGTVAPSYVPDKTTGTRVFVEGYNEKTLEDLEAMGYEGVLPEAEELFNKYIPTEEDFNDLTHGVKKYEDTQVMYMYERPVPSAQFKEPTFVIVYGKFKGDGNYYYYKIDLADQSSGEHSYYPIFRNFQYQIKIHEIQSVGYDTPEKAASSPGGVNVSADVTASHFTDISDGVAHLVVQPWMQKSYHSAKQDTLYVKFISNINETDPTYVDPGLTKWKEGNESDPDENPVTFEYPDGNEIAEVLSFGPPDADGWRMLIFKTVAPGSDWGGERTQTIRVKGVYGQKIGVTDVRKILYRDIEITVLPVQTMFAACCSPEDRASLVGVRLDDWPKPRLKPIDGTEALPFLNLEIAIPAEGLVESMFPLNLVIEPESMTLTPEANETLPVVSGQSISGKSTFQYVKSLTWGEYQALQAGGPNTVWKESDGKDYCHISCGFMTNRRESASIIYVGNEFFSTATTEFDNDHTFTDLSFQTSLATGKKVKVHFEVEERPAAPYGYPQVLLETTGMTIDGLSPLEAGTTKYYFTPTNPETVFTCSLASSLGEDEEVSFKVSSNNYTSKQISSHHFRIIGFLDGIVNSSHVVHGAINVPSDNKAKNAPFGYCHAPGHPAPIKLLNVGNNDRFEALGYNYNGTTYEVQTSSITNYGTDRVDSTYHEIKFQTKTTYNDPIPAFRIVANGYWEKTVPGTERFTGTIYGYSNNGGFSGNNLIPAGFMYKGDNERVKATIDFSGDGIIVGEHLVKTSNGLKIDPKGSTKNLLVTVNSENQDKQLYYVEILFDKNPDGLSVSAADAEKGAKVVQYLGSKAPNLQFIWTTPKDPDPYNATTTLTVTVNEIIYIKKIIIRSVQYTTD